MSRNRDSLIVLLPSRRHFPSRVTFGRPPWAACLHSFLSQVRIHLARLGVDADRYRSKPWRGRHRPHRRRMYVREPFFYFQSCKYSTNQRTIHQTLRNDPSARPATAPLVPKGPKDGQPRQKIRGLALAISGAAVYALILSQP